MRIQHNSMALYSSYQYQKNVSAQSSTLEKLSSGYRINRAGDDAAGLSISEKMCAQITGINSAEKNVKDGLSLVRTAEGAIQEIQDMLLRMVTLAEQSANGIYDNELDRANLQKELEEMLNDIDRIANSVNFNGIALLDGSLARERIYALSSEELKARLLETVTELDGVSVAETSASFRMAAFMSTRAASTTYGDFTVTGGEEGIDFEWDENREELTILSDAAITITGTKKTTNQIIIARDIDANITLNNVNIDTSAASYGAAIQIEDGSAGNVTITLTGSNTLKASSGHAALEKNGSDGTLTIQGAGTLTATGGDSAAGIGGGSRQDSGNITLSGTGTITAYGGDNGSGIGGGGNGSGTNIIVNSGTVKAYGGAGAAGIGGCAEGSNIKITGGTVTAAGGEGAAGIGGGSRSTGTNIEITGGTVNATGGDCGAGIGGGDSAAGGNIKITGGTVTATGKGGGAGIGGGDYGDGGQIEIDGSAKVTATGSAYDDIGGGAGVGGGRNGSAADISISVGASGWVKATGGEGGAGIGSGTNLNGVVTATNIEITTGGSGTTAGYVTATGNGGGAGIGGGSGAAADNISIDVTKRTDSSGNLIDSVNAIGKSGGAGIGGGLNGSGTQIIIQGTGRVTASGNRVQDKGTLEWYGGGAGIGGGSDGEGSDIKIQGGVAVVATGNEGGAGIGGGAGKNGSEITIDTTGAVTAKGGTTSTGNTGGAGIGGGSGGDGTQITITNKGNVTATGSLGGAGIGGGALGAGKDIVIDRTGGTITSTGGAGDSGSDSAGAGIGGGDYGEGTNIIIKGTGTVTAAGGGFGDAGGAGIGGGGGKIGSQITIEGCTVNATGKNGGAGIGGGSGADGTDIEITGGTVTGNGNAGGAGIGGGIGGAGTRIEITGTAAVTGKGNTGGGAGIGGGSGGAGSDISIDTTKTVTTTGGTLGGAGIGGGADGVGSNITIQSGTISATGGSGTDDGKLVAGAGIGGGNNANGDQIHITGTAVVSKATGGTNGGAGIGGGSNGSGTNIVIDGSAKVTTATGGRGGAGIGGGRGKTGSDITITDNANVTATGGLGQIDGAYYAGAGVGGGDGASGERITINGSATVKATGAGNSSAGGAGIGGGDRGNASDIIIMTDKDVTVKGGYGGAGVGGGAGNTNGTDLLVVQMGENKTGSGKYTITAGTGADAIGSGDRGSQSSSLVIIGTTGTVTGDMNLDEDVTIKPGVTVSVGADASLTIGSNSILDNDGTILNEGNIYNYGTVDNTDGMIKNIDDGNFYNYGIFLGNPVEGDGFRSPVTVTFDDGMGNTTNVIIEGTYGDVLEQQMKDRVGYTFLGWFTEKDGGDQVNADTQAASEPHTLYAHWQLNTYTITYDPQGGTNPNGNSLTFTVEDGSIALSTPDRAGYTFDGWYVQNDDGTESKVDTAKLLKEPKDITLYAHWSVVKYQISYDLDGGTLGNGVANPSEYTVESGDITLNEPTRKGYKFLGWTWDGQDTPQSNVTIPAGSTGNIAFKANWELIDYKINYNLDGGALEPGSTNPDTYNVSDKAVNNIASPIKKGYKFLGWYTSETGDDKFNAKELLANPGDITLYARWELLNYTITYHLAGGTNPESNPKTYTINDSSLALADPERKGYIFDGWYTSASGTEKVDFDALLQNPQNVSVYAHWIANQYTVILDPGDGTLSGDNTVTVTYDGKYGALPEPEITDGRKFMGWYTEADGKGNRITSDSTVKLDADITLYAFWADKDVPDPEPDTPDPPDPGEGRLASAMLDLSGLIADGTTIRLGKATYTFAVGSDSIYRGGANVIYLTESDALDEELAVRKLAAFAAGNSIFNVDWTEGAKLSLQQRQSVTEITDVGGILDYIGITTTRRGSPLILQIGSSSNGYDQLKVYIQDMHTEALGIKSGEALSSISIAAQDAAQSAIETIQSAISYVSDARGGLGAVYNRLEHTIYSLAVSKENLINSESTIRDTDIADMMMLYTKNSILMQASQAMLAQANQIPQGILWLLR